MSAEDRSHEPQVADVCLLLEGTYPYVRGGVSAWLHQLIQALPELRFALVFLGGRRAYYGPAYYRLPPNVVHSEVHYLEDALREPASRSAVLSESGVSDVRELHVALERIAPPGACTRPEPALDRTLRELQRPGGLNLEQFLYSPGAWGVICDAHTAHDGEESFLDYFWTLRWLHAPLFYLARIADRVPEARVYHSVSTGYAGFLGALLERRRGRPLLLSEHDSHAKERRKELQRAEWLGGKAPERVLTDPAVALRQLWLRYFESLGRLTYRSANPIVSLYEGSRELQVASGAARERTRVIANGVDSAVLESALLARPEVVPHVIGLVGRVVPINDIETFVRAVAAAAAALPDVQGWVFGSTDDDPRYAEQCKALARSLGLTGRVHFFGHRALVDVFPKLGVLMLSSVSESQPLVVLEAFAAGLPCVLTDVGACRELIEGREPDDRALGAAGRVAPVADPEALARAAVELLADPHAWQACQFTGLTRVRRHYTYGAMLDAYRALYREALERDMR